MYYTVIDQQYGHLVIRTSSPSVAEYYQQQTNKADPNKPYFAPLDLGNYLP